MKEIKGWKVTMLTQNDFDGLCRRLNLNAADRALVKQIRERIDHPAAFPSAAIVFTKPKERGQFKSRKMNRTFPFLIGQHQLLVFQHLEDAYDVLEYIPHPGMLREATIDETQPSLIHYPQFFVIRRDSVGWEGWLHDDQPASEYVLGRGQLTYRRHARSAFDDRTRQVAAFLERYARADCKPVLEEVTAQVLRVVVANEGITLAELCRTAEATVENVYVMMVDGSIIPSVLDGDLTATNEVKCYPRSIPIDLEAARAAGIREKTDALVAQLREPEMHDDRSFEELRHHALTNRDQRVQKAAITGLTRLGGEAAVLTLTERLLDTWGMGALERAISALVRLHNDGGLLALTATLLLDNRFYKTKLDALAKGTRALRNKQAAHSIERLGKLQGTFDAPNVRPTLIALAQLAIPDIAHGATLARLVTRLPSRMVDQGENQRFFDILRASTPQWPGNVEPLNPELVDEAIRYAKERLGGLIELLDIDTPNDAGLVS